MNKKNLGFSLIELSVVILIIGLLVIGISKGSRIIQSSRLASARSLTTSSPVASTSDLVLWLETSLPSSFDANISPGTGILNWFDNNPLSTNKNNARQSTGGYQPTYRENIVNGIPAVTFDITDDHIIVPNFELRNVGRGGYTYFMVMSKTQTNRGDPFIYKLGDGSQDDFGIITEFGKVLYFSKVNGVTEIIGVAGAATVDNRFFVLSVTRNNSIYTGYVNGTQDYTTTVAADMSGIDVGTPLYIGSNHDGAYLPTLPFGGYITEVIVFNRALKAQERKDIEQYLGKKYNIKVS